MTPDETAVSVLKAIAQSWLRPADPAPIPDPSLAPVLIAAFGDHRAVASEGELARAALALLSEDPDFAEPIRLMSAQADSAQQPQRYIEPATIALTTAALVALQTRIKFKRDQSGKWSIEVDKKAAGDSAIKLVVEHLLPFLKK